MPQMSPIMWFTMFLIFSSTMIMFNQIMFFMFQPNKLSFSSKKLNKMQFNWKW
uniref:ATP synthase complex subunit 8 n=1 Tax=Atractomorpha sinensis TaxID=244711 RepID=B8PWJ1_9ORTH|nr:ATP synthase F0 subunit 8 [Atractomorpha sinensis]ABX11508.1 ATP synthase F0 subunit 8 [Atractomorpha sinensis]